MRILNVFHISLNDIYEVSFGYAGRAAEASEPGRVESGFIYYGIPNIIVDGI